VIYRKTCKQGHRLAEHAYFATNGNGLPYRRCRVCHVMRNRRYKEYLRKRRPSIQAWI
jgi:hypothetical protein